jgi:hypothetical protein
MKKFHKPQTTNRKPLIAFCLLLSAFCFLPSVSFAQKQQKIEVQTKVFTNSFKVNPKDIIEVKTNYTKVTFQEWDKNEVDFITTISLKQASEKDMERVLNSFTLTNKQFGKRTTYTSSLSCSGDKKWNNISCNLEIVLLIKIPKDIFIEIESCYGNVEIINVQNDFTADIRYGNLNVENLHGKKNSINIKYGNFNVDYLSGNSNNIDIKYGKFYIFQAEQLTLNVGYVKGDLKEAGALKLNSKYSTIKMDRVQTIELFSCYDKIYVQNTIDKIEGEMKYGTLMIKSLTNTCILKSFVYSKITIDKVLKTFTNISFLSSYSNIVLNIPNDISFAFDYSGRYTDFKDKNIKLNDATFEASNNSVQMSGIYGKDNNSGKSVSIQATYGTVSLFER